MNMPPFITSFPINGYGGVMDILGCVSCVYGQEEKLQAARDICPQPQETGVSYTPEWSWLTPQHRSPELL